MGGATASGFIDDIVNSAEFFGIFRNDMPRIARVQLDAGGDGRWGLDNIEYGRLEAVTGVPEPSTRRCWHSGWCWRQRHDGRFHDILGEKAHNSAVAVYSGLL